MSPTPTQQMRFTDEERHVIAKALMARIAQDAAAADPPLGERERYVLYQQLERFTMG